MKFDDIVPWGRSFDEYIRMFSLSDTDLRGAILGCGDGPASFNAELTRRGGNCVSVDPIYAFSRQQIRQRIDDVFTDVMAQVREERNQFDWRYIGTPERLAEIRMTAMQIFLEDFDEGRDDDRYLMGALPSLAFEDAKFDLALCSHVLFLYSNVLCHQTHIDSIKTLCRVAREARIYPLTDLNGGISPYLGNVIADLSEQGYKLSLVDVEYRVQKQATQMLRISASG
ncbi:Uncharacterised protein [BD1-7 clade bacterium]|uniref:SAM-dependent methyltransferase n=1 Tax=BD1-7 clade bacterium TaxID=2029982 RepID=A0A5S9NSZ4_9GAMM|nr:Uncharacterised protein [BD1-7 clade bacterium]CAA0093682.1 Uncharacterised protein [BD1-7 clade bacterium]